MLTGVICALVATAAPGAEIALVPVGASGGHSINGNEITLTSGGQRIFLEFRASGWAPDAIKAYQVTLDSAGFYSGASGSLGPAMAACATSGDCAGAFGGTCSILGDPCTQSSDCQFPQFEVCTGPPCGFPIGIGGNCNPAFISSARSDYIFNALNGLPAVDLSSSNVRLAAALLSSTEAVVDSGTDVYLGTIVLDATADASGTFMVGFVANSSVDTSLVRVDSAPVTPISLVPVLITFGCATDADCVDASPCTADVCDVTGVCVHSPNYDDATECCNPDDGSLCTKPAGLAGDFNGDGAVDMADFSSLQRCFGGAAQGLDCEAVDLDCNCTIDAADMAAFVTVMTGP